MTLPKFSGMRPRCPKCTTVDSHSAKFELHAPSSGGARQERMVRFCASCNYVWYEQPADSPEPDPRAPRQEEASKPGVPSAPSSLDDLVKTILSDEKLVQWAGNLLKRMK